MSIEPPANPGRSCKPVPADVIEKMMQLLPCQSKDVVMDVLGISSNTWLKVKKGQPIRSSIAERLAGRFRAV